jgi:hypothetical protein
LATHHQELDPVALEQGENFVTVEFGSAGSPIAVEVRCTTREVLGNVGLELGEARPAPACQHDGVV